MSSELDQWYYSVQIAKRDRRISQYREVVRRMTAWLRAMGCARFTRFTRENPGHLYLLAVGTEERYQVAMRRRDQYRASARRVAQYARDRHADLVERAGMDIKQIVREWLLKHGYTGLVGDECGCEIDDLFACLECPMTCEPGHKVDTPDGAWLICTTKELPENWRELLDP